MITRPLRRLPLRDLLTDAEKRTRDLVEQVHVTFLSRAADLRELSRPVRKRSHFPTLNALIEPRWAEEALVWHAVMDLGPRGTLRLAAAWSPAVRVLASHPELRRELIGGVFWKRSHAFLCLALVGVAVSRRFPPASLLALPYLRYLRATAYERATPLVWAPHIALTDLVEVLALVRGSAQARTLVL